MNADQLFALLAVLADYRLAVQQLQLENQQLHAELTQVKTREPKPTE